MKEFDEVKLNKHGKVQSLIDVSLDKIKSMIDVNCVVGSAITMPDDSVIIPISKVSVGFVAGGGEYNDLSTKRNSADFPMAGGTGGGFSVAPIGFFVVKNDSFKIIHADKSSAYMGLIKNATDVLKSFVEKIKND
ncbi:MAG: sporulation protein YtfJ [Clostridia bacterium]|nr:sporulation protein YtfJ [Clostridia bacterium]